MSAKFFLFPLAMLGLGTGVLLSRVVDARADSGHGLFFEESASANDVTVRRLRDRGEGMICYVANGWSTYNRTVAISCWPEGSR